MLNLAGLLLFFCFICFANKKYRSALVKSRCMSYFFCNGFIRLFMETFFELALTALVSIHTADWGTSFPGGRYSNGLSLISLFLLSMIPLCLTVFYCRSFKALTEVHFTKRYGAGLDGVNLVKKVSPKSILAYPVTFFSRRILFVVSAVYFEDFIWAQIAIIMMISVFMVMYLIHYKPMNSPFSNRMEVMNECTIIMLLYGLMCFTDFVPSPETRS